MGKYGSEKIDLKRENEGLMEDKKRQETEFKQERIKGNEGKAKFGGRRDTEV